MRKSRCNGARVRQLREQLDMTQEMLAEISHVTLRTVQRAEHGDPLRLETLANLASALKVTLDDLTLPKGDPDQTDRPETSASNAVVLRRITSGKALIDLVCGSFSTKLDCAVEPTTENIDALADMVERIETLIPDRSEERLSPESPSLSKLLREALVITAQLVELEKFGVAVFAGTYTAHAQVDHRSEPVTVCRITIHPIGVERMTVKVSDEWHGTNAGDQTDQATS